MSTRRVAGWILGIDVSEQQDKLPTLREAARGCAGVAGCMACEGRFPHLVAKNGDAASVLRDVLATSDPEDLVLWQIDTMQLVRRYGSWCFEEGAGRGNAMSRCSCHVGIEANLSKLVQRAVDLGQLQHKPIDMVLHCPACGMQHIDKADANDAHETGVCALVIGRGPYCTCDHWGNPPHKSHLCHGCGHIWRPADVPTNGVAAIQTKGKNDSPTKGL